MTQPALAQTEPAFTPAPFPQIEFGVARPEQVAGMTGLETLRAVVEGRLPAPPMAQTMQQWIHHLDHGLAEFRGNPAVAYLNPMGIVHGGWTMALLDSALGCAVHTVLAPGETFSSLGTEVKFNRPVTHKTGQVRAVATVLSRGRRTATSEARVTDMDGRLLATGTTTCFIESRGA
ncbi:PaaI family thioesterase [Chachezhania sediminis]|uniref:PaaI family thioesterase n=1 Tax=Chachezhania sediminis TaxID=2599291 RepID=UPI00131DEDF0|nr:PaaI family thioesterase [Chachezhania sediminis]